IFNPQNALFVAFPNDRRRFLPNPASKVEPLHLEYFCYFGRMIALTLMHKMQIGIVFERIVEHMSAEQRRMLLFFWTLIRTDKWAESELGTKWGDKWEEKFFGGIGSRQGETWHASPSSERWSRTWGEEHFGNGKVHKYGKSTTGESWDMVVDEKTYYESQPHYGWADVVGDSSQLFSIQPREQPPRVYPNIDFGSSVPSDDESPPTR
ncbi:hypothetical protein HAX54_004525, partial [Datura stramonium]|nr:hypothetical protein [Datura stramonium]